MVSLVGFSFLVYIAREAEATAELNQQTKGIILMCGVTNCVLMRSNRSQESHQALSLITTLACLHYG